MDCLKSHNVCVNTIMFPGAFAQSSYGADTYSFPSSRLKMIYIPYSTDSPFAWSSISSCNLFSDPPPIPALLATNPKGKLFCIHFHGNACDIGQIAICASKESSALYSHYLLVEYPGYGLAAGQSFASEYNINHMAFSVLQFVMKSFHIPANRIVLIGRSIGAGPVCYLASHLQSKGFPPLSIVLHSPYASINDATSDLLGSTMSHCMLNRWPNYHNLVGDYSQKSHVIQCPVLFLHADGDAVINCRHSILLHEHRVKAGLPSELFIQQSNEYIIKGHNYFDYEHDVVAPIKSFMLKICPGYLSQLETIQIPQDTLERVSQIPEAYRKKTDEYYMSMNVQGEKSQIYTCSNITLWCFCPCIFTTECCFACGQYGIESTCCYDDKAFSYQRLRPKDQKQGSLLNILLRKKSFDRIVNEEAAAKSLTNNTLNQTANTTITQKSTVQEQSNTQNPLLLVTDADEVLRSRRRSSDTKNRPSLADKMELDEDVSLPPAILPGHVFKQNSNRNSEGTKDSASGQGDNHQAINYIPG